ncbi:MAG: SUF system Fe-S cluster assembly regulator [Alphaproteobacteria bacterium]|nr:SUF system Fe-S cluster assembly regulator [Alphaproteobacteria bacterium]
MLRLNKLTDYAVVLLTTMSAQNRITTVTGLAQCTAIPAPTIAKVLKRLAKSDIVTAQRGAAGGYRLARPAVSITVADIITAMDGPIALTDCAEGHQKTCGMEHSCSMQGHWNKVNLAIRAALENVTLADMTSPALRALQVEDMPRTGAQA